MTVNDWISVFSGITTQLQGIGTQLSSLGTQIGNLTTQMTAINTTMNVLGLLSIQLAFVVAFVVIAYWKRTLELYVMSGLVSILFGYQWLKPAEDTFFIGIACMVLGLTTILRGTIAQVKKSRG